jgi:hypothetical protein
VRPSSRAAHATTASGPSSRPAADIERLYARGVVGPHTPSGVRDVLIRSGAAEA